MESKLYFKITNKEECHNGFQYVDGLNILDKPFEEEKSCVPGGLYFSDAENILNFLSYGVFLREVTLPTEDPEFKMVADPAGGKWRANKIILRKRYDLTKKETFEYLVSLGANIKVDDNLAIRWASKNGYLEIVKYLVSLGIDIKAYNNCAVITASENGHLETVKYLVSVGADIKACNNYAIGLASSNGHLETVKYLVSLGADIKARNNYAMRWASVNGHLETVEYLVSLGAELKN